MATAVEAQSETAPISLYFGLEEGKRADLVTVAKAAIEWTEAVRDLAAMLTPDLEFEIEFVESEEGSVWLSNLIKAVRSGDRKALASLTFAVVLFFAMGPLLHLQTDAGNEFWRKLGHVDTADLSDADKTDIARKVVDALENSELGERRRKIVRQVEQDLHVTSVGVGYAPTKSGPIAAISREHFPSYETVPPPEDFVEKDTLIRVRVLVTIVRASLRENEAKPRWRFSDGESEWSADIEDAEFVVALNHEETGLPLAVGQQMTVNVAIDGKKINGAWHEENRRITKVLEPKFKREQEDLLGYE